MYHGTVLFKSSSVDFLLTPSFSAFDVYPPASLHRVRELDAVGPHSRSPVPRLVEPR